MATRRDLIALAALKKARIAAAAARKTAEKARPGRDGRDGISPEPVAGPPGPRGPQGVGVKGEDGVGIADVKVDLKARTLRFGIVLDDGRRIDRSVTLPEVEEDDDGKGKRVPAGFTVRTAMGPAGAKIVSAAANPDNSITFTLSDGSTVTTNPLNVATGGGTTAAIVDGGSPSTVFTDPGLRVDFGGAV